jgi:hypothetical protein
VLIDEADVFMAQRSMDELARNALVSGQSSYTVRPLSLTLSVMLRTLEYFEGIMFLTTNRIGTIDLAFKSRLHLSLSYPALNRESRRKLWKNFIRQGTPGMSPSWLDTDFLDTVSETPVNGRQIKNIVRMAHAQATSGQRELQAADITNGLMAHEDFDIEFRKAKGLTEFGGDGEGEGSTGTSELRKTLGHIRTGAAWTLIVLVLALSWGKAIWELVIQWLEKGPWYRTGP